MKTGLVLLAILGAVAACALAPAAAQGTQHPLPPEGSLTSWAGNVGWSVGPGPGSDGVNLYRSPNWGRSWDITAWDAGSDQVYIEIVQATDRRTVMLGYKDDEHATHILSMTTDGGRTWTYEPVPWCWLPD